MEKDIRDLDCQINFNKTDADSSSIDGSDRGSDSDSDSSSDSGTTGEKILTVNPTTFVEVIKDTYDLFGRVVNSPKFINYSNGSTPFTSGDIWSLFLSQCIIREHFYELGHLADSLIESKDEDRSGMRALVKERLNLKEFY